MMHTKSDISHQPYVLTFLALVMVVVLYYVKRIVWFINRVHRCFNVVHRVLSFHDNCMSKETINRCWSLSPSFDGIRHFPK